MYTIEYHLKSGHTIAIKAEGKGWQRSYPEDVRSGAMIDLQVGVDAESGSAHIFLAEDVVAITVTNDTTGNDAAVEAFARAFESFTPTLKSKGLMPR